MEIIYAKSSQVSINLNNSFAVRAVSYMHPWLQMISFKLTLTLCIVYIISSNSYYNCLAIQIFPFLQGLKGIDYIHIFIHLDWSITEEKRILDYGRIYLWPESFHRKTYLFRWRYSDSTEKLLRIRFMVY